MIPAFTHILSAVIGFSMSMLANGAPSQWSLGIVFPIIFMGVFAIVDASS